ncbi:enoyl-CoA hydratase/isomerase family protein [Enemella sp. A6]|uniref:enoyl-CoA hydratase/isomerase family protein n=1 Tax=Enemella sp. A6 TaxID=3440152 RepID=UPI003EBBE991
MSNLLVSHEGKVAVLELNQPPANFFNHELLTEIHDAIVEVSSDDRCRAVLLCSAGKHFCAGANLSEGGLGEELVDWARTLYATAVTLFDLELPIVAAVQGTAVGGGLGLACVADLRVASPSTRFHANFAGLGFHQGFGLSVTLPRIIGEQAATDMLLTARRVTGEEAHRLGLADRLVEDGRVREEGLALAEQIAAQAPIAVRSMRKTLRGDLADRVRAALRHELAEQAQHWSTADCEAGIAANLRRETPEFHGR